MVLATLSLSAQNTSKTQKSSSTTQSSSVQQKSGSSSSKSSATTSSSKSGSTASSQKQSASSQKSGSSKQSASSQQSSSAKQSASQSSSTAKKQQSQQNNNSKKKEAEKDKDKKDKKDKDDVYSKIRFGATGAVGLWMGSPALFQARAGADARMPFLLPHAYLMGGARLSLRGCNPQPWGQLSTLYLEVPVRFGYTLSLGDNLALFGEVGPYVDVRLIRFKKHDTTCSRFMDLGLGADAGLEVGHHLRFSLGLDFGFFRPCIAEHTINNGVWLTTTYLF